MHILFLLLVLAIIYNCGDFIPDKVKEWWKNLELFKWFYPLLMTVITVAVVLGIKFGVLNWSAVFIPGLFVIPYIYGLVLGFWHKMKGVGQHAAKDEVDTKEIVLNCLIEIGCQPEANPDGIVSVSYQGENFVITTGGVYAQIWDFGWTHIKADDAAMPLLREAANHANFDFGPTVVFTEPDEDGVIGVHSRQDIMLHPACPDNTPYVKAVLDSFFEVKEQVCKCCHQLNNQQPQRNPIGFNTQPYQYN